MPQPPQNKKLNPLKYMKESIITELFLVNLG